MVKYNYRAESWTEYAVGVLVIFLRWYARWKVGPWLADDYLMAVVLCIWTVTPVLREEIIKGSKEPIGPHMAPEALASRQHAMMLNFVGWTLQVPLMWGLKACLCILYARLCENLPLHRFVKIVSWFVGLSFIGAYLELFLHCLPIQRTWQVWPIQPWQCQTGNMNYLVVGLLNVLTDVALFSIAVTILIKARFPLRKKVVMAFLLCSGLLTILATILRNVSGYLIQVRKPDGNFNQEAARGWSARETFTAVVVVNIPSLRPLISSKRWINSDVKELSPRGEINQVRRDTDDGAKSSTRSGSGSGPDAAAASSSFAFFRKYHISRSLLGTTASAAGASAYYEEKAPDVVALAIPEPSHSSQDNGFLDDLEAKASRES